MSAWWHGGAHPADLHDPPPHGVLIPQTPPQLDHRVQEATPDDGAPADDDARSRARGGGRASKRRKQGSTPQSGQNAMGRCRRGPPTTFTPRRAENEVGWRLGEVPALNAVHHATLGRLHATSAQRGVSPPTRWAWLLATFGDVAQGRRGDRPPTSAAGDRDNTGAPYLRRLFPTIDDQPSDTNDATKLWVHLLRSVDEGRRVQWLLWIHHITAMPGKRTATPTKSLWAAVKLLLMNGTFCSTWSRVPENLLCPQSSYSAKNLQRSLTELLAPRDVEPLAGPAFVVPDELAAPPDHLYATVLLNTGDARCAEYVRAYAATLLDPPPADEAW